jgi:hypothetical protein
MEQTQVPFETPIGKTAIRNLRSALSSNRQSQNKKTTIFPNQPSANPDAQNFVTKSQLDESIDGI